MAEAGIIMPTSALPYFGERPFHLTLAHLLLEDDIYLEWYSGEADRGSFITIDNGAHELGAPLEPATLLNLAMTVNASEIACADMIFDGRATTAIASEALAYYGANRHFIDKFDIRIMIIPHGNSIFEWGLCLRTLIEMHKQFLPGRPYTIGFGYRYQIFHGGLRNLLMRFILPRVQADPTIDVHLLGMPQPQSVLQTVRALFPALRSTDSAKPFSYATAGLLMDEYLQGIDTRYPGRPENFFALLEDAYDRQVVAANIATYERMANHNVIDHLLKGES